MDIMRTVIFSDSILISAIRPYFWTLTLFGILLPQNYILRTMSTNRQWLLVLTRIVFTIYALLQWTFTGFWIAYLNKNFLNNYVRRNSLDSKTYILTIGIIIVQLIVQTVIHTQALMGHQHLRRILINVVQLESNIREHASAVCSLCAIRWRLFLHIGIWLLVLCTFIVYLYYELSPGEYTALHQVVSIFGYTLTQMKGVEYCVSVQLIHELLHLVQQQLVHLSWKLARCESMALRWDLFAELQTNQELLARVWHLLNQVQRYFYLPMLMLFFCNGFLMTQTIHWGYINLELDDLKLRLCRIAYIVMMIISLFIPCYRSQCCIDEYNRFGTILHKLKTVGGIDEQLSMRLQEYSLQLMHQKMLFTCGGFFDINLKNFGTIILTIATYIVILIQFKLQAETGRKSRIEVRME